MAEALRARNARVREDRNTRLGESRRATQGSPLRRRTVGGLRNVAQELCSAEVRVFCGLLRSSLVACQDDRLESKSYRTTGLSYLGDMCCAVQSLRMRAMTCSLPPLSWRTNS